MDFKSRPSATALEAESSDWIWFGCGGTKASVFFRNTRRTKMSAGAVLRRLGRTRGRKRRERETEGARASEAGAGEQRTTPTSTEEGRRGETGGGERLMVSSPRRWLRADRCCCCWDLYNIAACLGKQDVKLHFPVVLGQVQTEHHLSDSL